jgi:acyl carrier protein
MAITDKGKILSLVVDAVQEIGREENIHSLMKANIETSLYGSGSNLDSLMLVRLISEVEERLYAELGIEVAIADERAMSQKHSPFLSVRSLVDYIDKLLSE